MTTTEAPDLLAQLFRAAVVAADPERATRQAVGELEGLRPAWIIALGKGAHHMASGAVMGLRERNDQIAGGLVVANENDESATHGLPSCIGDHPTPDANSFLAAQRLAEVAARTTADADALVLISGGTTSLVASPIEGVSHSDVSEAFDALLASGADITVMNAIRKRMLRFAGGRLAIALGTRHVHCLIASDVVGNDLRAIASGPCVADNATASDVRARARKAGAWDSLPDSVRTLLDAMAEGRTPDVPPADHPRFATTTARVILDRTDAERGAAAEARRRGLVAEIMAEPLSGEAAEAGRRFATAFLEEPAGRARCVLQSGETTVTLGATRPPGGRCQEFALAAALRLEEAEDRSRGMAILAAGTDGRDGPTDAAGAVIDAGTCARIRARGIDPAAALRQHNSYHALEAAGALLKTGPTGTNVNDLIIALHP